ncbi:hypothetical protein PYW07_000307 [Mythimna separata]|uniref:Uncharacterized protein n=1 Tax=Mythimna separata TaxID=271217 RepID=A0AAD8E0F9_MYTSE|nr:hypothetical protein PYW07_000307 [Mythimna separata]
MLKFVVFALVALLLVAVRASPVQQKVEQQLQIIQLEEPCVLQGGLCARADDCDPENFPLLGANLCPKQRHLGVVCCYM